MERYTRKTEKPLNQLDKPIYRVADVGGWSVHHNKMKKGQSLDVPVKTLHQRGSARRQDAGRGDVAAGRGFAATPRLAVPRGGIAATSRPGEGDPRWGIAATSRPGLSAGASRRRLG